MFGQNFYHALTRKYVTLFGTLFNDFTITRTGGTPAVTDTIKVPLTYSSQDKMLSRVFGDEDLDRKVAARTPAMSFEMLAPYYDAERKLASLNRICIVGNDGLQFQYVGVPYNIPFRLYVYSRDEEDGLKIIEKIFPYFTPSLTVTARLVDETDFSLDIPIVLKNINYENDSYGDYNDRRKLIWTLDFEMKAVFLGPVIGGRKIIRVAFVNARDSGTGQTLETVRVQPGLTANGEPTTDPLLSIPVAQINEDDNFGYIVEIIDGDFE
jgi:hypothetical protein